MNSNILNSKDIEAFCKLNKDLEAYRIDELEYFNWIETIWIIFWFYVNILLDIYFILSNLIV